MGCIHIVVQFYKSFIGIAGMGDLSFKQAIGKVWTGGKIGIHDLAGHRVDSGWRNNTTREGNAVQRVYGRSSGGCGKVARFFQRIKWNGGVVEHAGAFPQSGISAEDECLIANDGAAQRSTELIAMQWIFQRATTRNPAIGIQLVVT